MMELLGIVTLCSILLGSPGVKSLSLHKRDVVDMAETNGGFGIVGTDNSSRSKLYTEPSLITSQPTAGNNASSNGTFSNNLLTGERESPNQYNTTGNVTMRTETSAITSPNSVFGANSTEKEKALMENGILTTLASTAVDISRVTSSFGETTNPSQVEDGKNRKTQESNLENPSQVNTVDMLTTNPRTSSINTEDGLSTTALNLADLPVISTLGSTLKEETSSEITLATLPGVENSPSYSVYGGSETPTLISGESTRSSITASPVSEEWDDTKITTQIALTDNTENDLISSHDTTTYITDVGTEGKVNTTFMTGLVSKPESETFFGTTEGIGFTLSTEDIVDYHEHNVSGSAEPIVEFIADTDPYVTIVATSDQNLESKSPLYTAGVNQQSSAEAVHSNATLTAAILKEDTTEDVTREPAARDNAEEAASENPLKGISPLLPESSSTSAEGWNPVSKEDVFLSVSVAPAVRSEEPVEADNTVTITAVTSVPFSPQVNVMAPPVRQVTATAGGVLEKPDSEGTEGDEEDDEEEDDDEDDGDEEEDDDEDDKYTDSINESLEGDADLPPFTLPGLSSQEPLEDKNNVVLMDGTAYQVPDTQEWEQQNQGLVRSWMEKLKDKAGYMSGMLAPVGVGISGALTILGVLYSIKIINRRRRNGFKQHKRKREFNSMQDRVMLLADSSEDEF
ncbi:armadillo-like helical domain-containing protein 4 isoform X2 [Pelobates fuscus]|uniref:armadillo-like helical domain-containing protein 4 isoform X2 n=1 Tax=Pelobates fuscus TaxID=191477 RepID=UPI002FE47362